MINVYISSCDKNGGVFRFEMMADGRLRELDFTPVSTPSYFAIADGRLHMTLRAPYDDCDVSAYTSFELLDGGALGKMSEMLSADGISACHLTVIDGVPYDTNYMTGGIKRFPDKLLTRKGRGLTPKRQECPHPHCILPTPDGLYLAVVDLGLDSITVFDFDLNEISVERSLPGQGPRHITFSPDGKLAYVINEIEAVTTVYNYSSGRFTRLADYSARKYPFVGSFNGEGAGSAIRCVGDYLYVALREDNVITCYRRVGEELEYIYSADCGGDHPRDFNVFGDTLISANMNSDDVSVFKIIEGKGLEKLQTINIKCPTCVAFLEI